MTVPLRLGCFDSGLGGLSVLRHAVRRVPAEWRFLGDSANAPWGEADPHWVRARSLTLARTLIDQGAEALVIACNTATALAVEAVRARFEVPVIAIEPAVKPAASTTRSGRIAVLGTRTTLRSARYRALLARHASHLTVHELAPHHWIEAIELGRAEGDAFDARLRRDLAPLVDAGVDTWVLACTHFPIIGERLAAVLPPDARLLDPAEAVTARLERLLGDRLDPGGPARLRLSTSGDPERARTLWRRMVPDVPCEVVPWIEPDSGRSSGQPAPQPLPARGRAPD